jgi:hypothetical protein
MKSARQSRKGNLTQKRSPDFLSIEARVLPDVYTKSRPNPTTELALSQTS